MKIRSQLLLLMLITLFITTSLVGGVQMYTAYVQAQKNMENTLQHQANQFSNQMETWFTMIYQNGHFFANQRFVQNANQEEMQKLLGDLHNELGVYDHLMLAKPDGTLTNVYPFNPNLIGTGVKDYTYFKDTVALKTSQISKVTTNAKTGKATIIITQPIMNPKGELTAVLLQDINLDLLQDMADDAKIGRSGQTIIFAADGQVLTARGNQTYGPVAIVDTLSEVLKRDLHDMVEFTNREGQKIMAATNRIRTPGWGIAVTITQAEVLQSFYDSAKYGASTFCIIFIFLAFISSMVFNRLFGSITIVTEQFANMNSGNFSSARINDSLIQSAPQELRQLCITFNTMAETIANNIELISSANDQLERKVELRTQDLLGMNQELQAMNEELQQALENLHQTQAQLVQSEKMASLGNLVAGIAHEINTPIGVGVTATSHLQKITQEFIALYKSGGLKRTDLITYLEESDEAASIIGSNLDRASQLVRSFKQVSVDQSSEGRRVFNAAHYLGELLLSLQPKLKRTHHKVLVHCDENLEIDSFPGAFAQIITNLIMNSLLHAYEPDARGQMTIQIITVDNQRIQLTYRDDGKGMEQSIVDKIFNPFFTTKRGKGGTGLGMYVVYNIVTQQFGGTIECISDLGKGTTFIIEFPLEREISYDDE